MRPVRVPGWMLVLMALYTLPLWWFCFGSVLHKVEARVIPMNVPCCEVCALRYPEQASTYLAACSW